jgi:sucrose phosphorylase
MDQNVTQRILHHLEFLYGPELAKNTWDKLTKLLDDFAHRHPELLKRTLEFTEKHSILITYGDQFQEKGRAPLDCLGEFLNRSIGEAINTVHILPFFPYSSDDGFSVIDYTRVDPQLGDWSLIGKLGQKYHLMFDYVLNHVSRQSEWFEQYLAGNPAYQDFFITVEPDVDLSSVVRPRALPLLTRYKANNREKWVWTTFSDDQIDLNFANPEVALKMIQILLEYVSAGAEIIRLDAIAYLWKTIGTSCIHLPETHFFVKLIRAILDAIAPGVVLITETNVPHQENISYFGSPIKLETPAGTLYRGDEAQLVYQFSLAPLVLHTFRTGDVEKLANWINSLSTPYPEALFFNFIASHDGIGVRPAEGILSGDEIEALVKVTLEHQGFVSYKTNPDGSKSPYELNITLYDWLNNPSAPDPEVDPRRFLASQALMLSLAGVPGIYIHSLFGSRNCLACVEETGRQRSINRQKFELPDIYSRLDNDNSREYRILHSYLDLLYTRQKQKALNPYATQRILNTDRRIFALYRFHEESGSNLLALINISAVPVQCEIQTAKYNLPDTNLWMDCLSGNNYANNNGKIELYLAPYQYLWLVPEG